MNKSNRKLLPAVTVAVVVLLVMCGTGSAGHIGVSKTTVPPGAEYRLGDTIVYNMSVQILGTAPSGYWFTVDVYDEYPDGTVEKLDADLTLTKNGGGEIQYYTKTYVVTASDVAAGEVLNKINATGTDSDKDNVAASTDYTSNMLEDPEADFNFVAGLCNRMVTFTPTATDPDGTIAKYDWDYGNDGSIDRTETTATPFTDGPFSPGYTDVKLTVTDNDGLTDWILRSVYVNSPPTISSLTASKTKVEVPPGAMVAFTGTGSDPDGDALTYTWAITDSTGTNIVEGPATFTGSSTLNYFVDEIPTTAILTITDPNNCVATASVRVGKLEERVPLLTPAGAFALIGMLCIVGAGRVLSKGRRS